MLFKREQFLDEVHEYAVSVMEGEHRSSWDNFRLRVGKAEAAERFWQICVSGVDQDAESFEDQFGFAYVTERGVGMTGGEKQRCRGKKKDGRRCTRKQGGVFCPQHWDQRTLADIRTEVLRLPTGELSETEEFEESENWEEAEWSALMARAKAASNGNRSEAVGRLLNFLRRQTAWMAGCLETDITTINGQATQRPPSPEALRLHGLAAEAYEAMQRGGKSVREAWQRLFAVIVEAEPAAKTIMAAAVINDTAAFPVLIEARPVIGPIVVRELRLVPGER